MRLRTYQRLAMTDAALMIPGLVAELRSKLEQSRLDQSGPEPKLIVDQMREEALEMRKHLAERAKAAAMRKKLNVGRNEPCPCGSGVKFKRCCIRKM